MTAHGTREGNARRQLWEHWFFIQAGVLHVGMQPDFVSRVWHSGSKREDRIQNQTLR